MSEYCTIVKYVNINFLHEHSKPSTFFFRFHTVNAIRVSETVPPGSDIPDEELYARPPSDSRAPRGWLVDLINRFRIKFI